MAKTTNLKPLPDPSAPGAWMTVEEVLQLLGVSRRTVDGWRKRPHDPFPSPKRLPNGCIRYSRIAVCCWLDALPDAA